jgi:hypothetical protein
MSMSEIPDMHLFELELGDEPTHSREDVAHLDLICDENGLIKEIDSRLEIRGVSSQRGEGSKLAQFQSELWRASTTHKMSVVAKLASIGREDLAGKLRECHTIETCRVCDGCRRVTVFFNRCERHYCPECAPRLARERRESVGWWASEIREPKHVVLTVRNTERLTKDYVQWFKQCFGKLRRRKFARGWRGGFYRLEVTLERKGWHLHLHALVDAGWIAGGTLAEEWAEVVGQDVAIVKVKDVHSKEYLAEVTKYTVKGSQMAGWEPEEIAEFIDAFDGVKTFGVFGSLYGKRTEYREWLDSLQGELPKCPCGCEKFSILSPDELAWQNLRREVEARSGRTSVPPPQPDLLYLPLVEGRPPLRWSFDPR